MTLLPDIGVGVTVVQAIAVARLGLRGETYTLSDLRVRFEHRRDERIIRLPRYPSSIPIHVDVDRAIVDKYLHCLVFCERLAQPALGGVSGWPSRFRTFDGSVNLLLAFSPYSRIICFTCLINDVFEGKPRNASHA